MEPPCQDWASFLSLPWRPDPVTPHGTLMQFCIDLDRDSRYMAMACTRNDRSRRTQLLVFASDVACQRSPGGGPAPVPQNAEQEMCPSPRPPPKCLRTLAQLSPHGPPSLGQGRASKWTRIISRHVHAPRWCVVDRNAPVLRIPDSRISFLLADGGGFISAAAEDLTSKGTPALPSRDSRQTTHQPKQDNLDSRISFIALHAWPHLKRAEPLMIFAI